MKEAIIGVDVDGVLNLHREQFSRLIEKICGKSISPESITKIPVSKCEGLSVDLADEESVFNDPEYWLSMPVEPTCAEALRKLQNHLSYQILVFTQRPWPKQSSFGNKKRAELVRKWRGIHSQWQHLPIAIEKVTRRWLEGAGIPFDELFVDETPFGEKSPARKDRADVSRERRVRFFVEDSLRNATELADICERVFLLNHPYNQSPSDGEALPGNLVRVSSWDEILDAITLIA